VKGRYTLMAEVTLFEALKKQNGVFRIQSNDLKSHAGNIALKDDIFDKKIKFMIGVDLTNQAYSEFKT